MNVSTWQFGDGNFATIPLTITAINTTEDWLLGTATLTHTYSSPGDYTAFMQSCCRISTSENNADGNFRTETVVNVGTGNSPPVSSLAPIIQVADNDPSISLQIPVTDPDLGDTTSFALATSAEAAGPGSFSQPPGLSVSNSGLLTWSTSDGVLPTVPGDLWSARARERL